MRGSRSNDGESPRSKRVAWKADAVSWLAIFEPSIRLEVPLFQRQHVWTEDRHRRPLWQLVEGIPPATESYLGWDGDALLDGWYVHEAVFSALAPFRIAA